MMANHCSLLACDNSSPTLVSSRPSWVSQDAMPLFWVEYPVSSLFLTGRLAGAVACLIDAFGGQLFVLSVAMLLVCNDMK